MSYHNDEINAEGWRPVTGYESFYHVSSLGRVKRVAGGRGVKEVGNILKPWLNREGYCVVMMSDGGRRSTRKTPTVHSLVALTFLGPRPTPDHQINHVNADRADNRLTNLEYVTRKGNMEHAVRLQRVAVGSRQGSARLREEDIPRIRALLGLVPDKQIAGWFGVTEMTISRIKHDKGWKHVACTGCCPAHCNRDQH